MSPEVTVLPNGLTVATHHMAHVETVSLAVSVGVGARNEGVAEHGISHFLEHMSFKGTAKRSAQGIAEEIEAVGGELNAATGLETTSYFARVLKGDEGLALELIADILLASRFDSAEIEREREVILQELASTRDNPEDIAYELVQEAAYPGQALGRNILGSEANVRAFQGPDFARFLVHHYGAQGMVLSAAGAIHHDALVRHAEALFGGLSRTEGQEAERARYEGGTRWDGKRFEQSHLVLAFEGPSVTAGDFLVAQVFSGLLGGGMSSRLFQEVREKRGLCYAIYSSAWGFRDTGMFAVHAATGADMMTELTRVVGDELARAAAEGPSDAELQRSRAQLKAGLLMSLESTGARTEQMARQILGFGRLIPAEELIARVDAVSRDDVTAYARRLIETRPSLAVVGAGRRSRALAEGALGSLRTSLSSDGGAPWPS